MNGSSKIKLLTEDELNNIEQNNQLLAAFSHHLEVLYEKNPGLQAPNGILYNFFYLGAVAAMDSMGHTAKQINKELHELIQIQATYAEAAKQDVEVPKV